MHCNIFLLVFTELLYLWSEIFSIFVSVYGIKLNLCCILYSIFIVNIVLFFNYFWSC